MIVLDKSTHGESISLPPRTFTKQFKIAVTFLKGYNGTFKVTISNNKFHFAKSITDKVGFIRINIPPGAYEIKNLTNESEGINIDEGLFNETDYPCTIRLNFSILGSIIETSRQETLINFLPDDCVRDFLGLNASTINEKHNLQPNPVDILTFDNIFLEIHIA